MDFKTLKKKLSETPGVYLMKDKGGRVLYVGKAANLKRRVSSYFERPHDRRIEKLVSEIADIECQQTDTAIEALILEAKLIKKFEPPYNIKEKDGKSFLYVEITGEKFPCVLLVRGKDTPGARSIRFGPFTSSSSLREALKIVRRIFPWSTHDSPFDFPLKAKTYNLKPVRSCFDYQIGLCPGTCVGIVSAKEYRKNIKNIVLFFEGKKEHIIKSLTREMEYTAKKLDFETAATLRKKIFALQHIQDVALISDNDIFLNSKSYILNSHFRIEGYDISNISGTSAVGSMVVFENGKPARAEYRKFKIRSAIGLNPTSSAGGDVGMLKEVLRRRFKRIPPALGWPLPSLILVDGGKPQVNAAKEILNEFSLRIPLVGIAKGPERKRNDVIGLIPKGIAKEILVRVRDEAHRFAIQYHRMLRRKNMLH